MEVMFRLIGSENDLDELKPDEENVHFCFRPSEKDLFKLVHKCPNIKIIQLPASYYNTLSNTTKKLVSLSNIDVRVGNVWGHRTDIDTYKKMNI